MCAASSLTPGPTDKRRSLVDLGISSIRSCSSDPGNFPVLSMRLSLDTPIASYFRLLEFEDQMILSAAANLFGCECRECRDGLGGEEGRHLIQQSMKRRLGPDRYSQIVMEVVGNRFEVRAPELNAWDPKRFATRFKRSFKMDFAVVR